MNYKKIYDDLIKNCKNKNINLNIFYEKHHIMPSCMCKYSKRYGEQKIYVFDICADDKTNIVNLLPREHFVAHLLLAKIYPNNKICFAALLMKSRAKNGRIYSFIMQYISNYQKDLMKRGIHNFQISNKQRLESGTHNFLKDINGDSISKQTQQNRIKNGTFHFQGESGSKFATERNYKWVQEGRHPMQNEHGKNKFKETRKRRIDSGNWHTKGVKPWNNNNTKYNSKLIYIKAQELFNIWNKDKSLGARKLAKIIQLEYSATFSTILAMFRNDWIPNIDETWLEFKSSFVEL